MRNQSGSILAVLLLLLPRIAFGWDSAGHQVIASEAYRELSPELKAEVIEVLRAHPDHARWQAGYRTNGSYDVFAYEFMRSSTWPDEIRNTGNKYDHPNWHFVDYPLRPPAFPLEPGPNPEDDVLFGVGQCEKVLSDTNADPELRAASLSYLIHLVGDMHQPLHCVSLFTDAYPTGDKGGNLFFVKPAQAGIALHSLWDGLLGTSGNPRTEWNYGIELDAKYTRASLPELAAHTTPKEWSLEGRELAIEKAYLRGELKGGTDWDNAPALPANYTNEAKVVAEKQAALAGFRLADEIKKYLKCAGQIPLLPVMATFVDPPAMPPKKIGSLEATNYYDETMVVTGKVVGVRVRPTITILDFDQPYPDSPFTAVVFRENAGLFGDLNRLTNLNVEITGTVTDYRGKPEIIMENTNQVRIIDGK